MNSDTKSKFAHLRKFVDGDKKTDIYELMKKYVKIGLLKNGKNDND